MASHSLAQLFESYSVRHLRGRSQETVRQYRIVFRHFERFLGHRPSLDDLTDSTVGAFLYEFRTGRSAATTNKARSHLLAIWRFAARNGLVDKWPDIAAEPEPERVPNAWSHAELRALFASCQQELGMIEGVPAGLFWLSLHEVVWDTAERIGALLPACWSNLNLETGWLLVPAEARKRKTRDKLYRLHENTISTLQLIVTPMRQRIWPWPHCLATFYRHYARILNRAGLSSDRRSKWHRMRRSVASWAAAAGMNPTDLLDHSSPTLAKKSYIDPRIVQVPQPADCLFRPMES